MRREVLLLFFVVLSLLFWGQLTSCTNSNNGEDSSERYDDTSEDMTAQSYSEYLNTAKSKLNEGDCESAQRNYNVYKKLSNKTDLSVEELIKNCKGCPTNGTLVHNNYTETAFGINMKMIWVEGGGFLMGCTSEQSDCDDDEKNVRRVTVDGFYIGMLEITQAQWEAVVGTNIYTQKNKAKENSTYGVGTDHPMYYVNWDEAMEFCRLLSNRTGKTYTLPTEAQWEYAARGGKKADGTKYAGSNVIDAVAWYRENSGRTSHVCGSKRANALGIYDMSGNVREWCKDWYASSYVSYDANNPTGPSSGSYRVIRGGSWYYNASNCRVATRFSNAPSRRDSNLGFRVVLIP